MSKKNSKVTVQAVEGGFTWTFADGEVVTLRVSDFSEAIQAHYAVHGLKQKHTDAYAGAKTQDEAYASFIKSVDACKAGLWGTRVAGEPREEPIEVLAQALSIVKYGATLASEKYAEILAKLKGFDKTKRDSYRRVPDVMVEVAKIKASKAPAAAATVLDEL